MQTRVDLDLAQSICVPGIGGLSKAGVDDNGSVSVAVLDPVENRTRHLGVYTVDGRWFPRSGWRGEFLQSLMVAPGSCRAVGYSRETLYFLGEEGKQRFPVDRRGTWVSAAISEGASLFVAVLQDLFGDTGAIIVANLSGDPAWTLETQFIPTASAIDPSGNRITVAGVDGTIVQYDARRRPIWRHWVDDLVVDLVCSPDGRCLALVAGSGPRGSGVLVIGAEGECIDFIRLPRPGETLCADAAGKRFAVVCAGSQECLALLSGVVGEGIDLEAPLLRNGGHGSTRLALSPVGTYVAVQTEDIAVDVFRVTERRQSRSERARWSVAVAQERLESGEPVAVLRWLADLLRDNPADPQLTDLFSQRVRREINLGLEEADRLFAEREWEQALRRLGGWDDSLGSNPSWDGRRHEIRASMLDSWLSEAFDHEKASDFESARQRYRDILRYEPLHVPGTEGLNRVEAELVATEIRLAQDDLKNRRFRQCHARIEAARNFGADPNLTTALWDECRVTEALLYADQLYGSKNYGAAEYQYLRVLELCPGHAAALRGLDFSRALKGDTQIDGRFSRLE